MRDRHTGLAHLRAVVGEFVRSFIASDVAVGLEPEQSDFGLYAREFGLGLLQPGVGVRP